MTADQDSLLAGVKTVKWRVYRQFQIAGEVLDAPVSGHRFELAAELHARWLSRRHTHEAGGHYTARRADA